jgi:predicted nuclease with TOPRIM domain
MKTEHTEEQIGCATNNSNCCKRTEVPSDEEVAALSDMREIKIRVKELKKRLSEISSLKGEYLEEKSRLEKELTALKSDWNELEQKREKAAHNRMIMLGYDKYEKNT